MEPVTEQNKTDVIDNNDDLKKDENAPENTESVEGLETPETQTPADDGTAPYNADALEESRNAWKYREEKRKREALEKELADTKAKLSVTPKEKPAIPEYSTFEGIADYNKAMAEYHEQLTDWKLEQRDELNAAKSHQKEVYERMHALESDYESQAEEMAKEYPDYYDKVEKNMYTPAMHEAIFKSENKAKIAYHLSNNQELNDKLLNASPVDVAMEISKLDLRIAHGLKGKKTNNLPPPINPVTGNDIVTKDTSKMSAQEYYDAKQGGLIK